MSYKISDLSQEGVFYKISALSQEGVLPGRRRLPRICKDSSPMLRTIDGKTEIKTNQIRCYTFRRFKKKDIYNIKSQLFSGPRKHRKCFLYYFLF